MLVCVCVCDRVSLHLGSRAWKRPQHHLPETQKSSLRRVRQPGHWGQVAGSSTLTFVSWTVLLIAILTWKDGCKGRRGRSLQTATESGSPRQRRGQSRRCSGDVILLGPCVAASWCLHGSPPRSSQRSGHRAVSTRQTPCLPPCWGPGPLPLCLQSAPRAARLKPAPPELLMIINGPGLGLCTMVECQMVVF